jgi:hypothetical protein
MRKLSEIISGINVKEIKYLNSIKETAEKIKQKYEDYRLEYLELRLAFKKDITVYTITDGALGFIKNTPIIEFPDKRPLFLNDPFIIEGRKEAPLFDDIIALGGFVDQNNFTLIAEFQNGGHMNLKEFGAFDAYKGEKIEEVQFKKDEKTEVTPTDRQRKIFSWIISLGVILDDTNTRVLIEDKNRKKNNRKSNLNEKRIFIDNGYVKEV